MEKLSTVDPYPRVMALVLGANEKVRPFLAPVNSLVRPVMAPPSARYSMGSPGLLGRLPPPPVVCPPVSYLLLPRRHTPLTVPILEAYVLTIGLTSFPFEVKLLVTQETRPSEPTPLRTETPMFAVSTLTVG